VKEKKKGERKEGASKTEKIRNVYRLVHRHAKDWERKLVEGREA